MARRPMLIESRRPVSAEVCRTPLLRLLLLQADEAALERRAPERGAIDPLRIGARNDPVPLAGYPVDGRERAQSRFLAALLRAHVGVALTTGKAAGVPRGLALRRRLLCGRWLLRAFLAGLLSRGTRRRRGACARLRGPGRRLWSSSGRRVV